MWHFLYNAGYYQLDVWQNVAVYDITCDLVVPSLSGFYPILGFIFFVSWGERGVDVKLVGRTLYNS